MHHTGAGTPSGKGLGLLLQGKLVIAITCLVAALYHEARGEPVDGQIAVAQVILNRVASPRYPDTICEVVYQPHQFSWARQPNLPMTDTAAISLATTIAEGVLHHKFDDFAQGATHYYNPEKASPFWADSPKFELIGQIGRHTFLKGY